MTAHAKGRRHDPIETQLGGTPGFPVDVRIFNPLETVARIAAGRFTPEIVEQAEMGAEFLPAARRGEFDCVLCRKPFVGLPVLVGWLETPGAPRRAAFGVCQSCDRPDVKERLYERLGAVETAIN